MPNQSDVVNASSTQLNLDIKPKKAVAKKKTVAEIISQPLEKITFKGKNEEHVVHVYHPISFNKEYIEGFLELSKKMKREVHLVDWNNTATPSYCVEEKKANSKAFFIMVPNSELAEYYDKGRIYSIYFSSIVLKMPFAHDQMMINKDEDEILGDSTTSSSNRLYDSGGNVIGNYCYSFFKMFIQFDYLAEITPEYYKAIFTFLGKNLSSGIQNNGFDITRELETVVVGYDNFYRGSLVRVKNNLEQSLRNNLAQLLEQQKAVTQYERKIMEISDNIKGAELRIADKEKTAATKEHLNKIFETLLNEKFRYIDYGSDRIVARTKLIYIDFIAPTKDGGDGKTSKRYKMGEYEITINLSGTVQLSNVTARMGNYDHPHVCDRTPCLGNLAQAVPKMIAEGDFLEVLLLMYDFLKTINRDGWYSSGKIYLWPVASSRLAKNTEQAVPPAPPEARCGDCDELESNCDCSHCEHCEELTDNCNCEFCEHCDRLAEDCDEDPCSTVARERAEEAQADSNSE